MYHLIDTCFINEHAGTARVFFIRFGGQSFLRCFTIAFWSLHGDQTTKKSKCWLFEEDFPQHTLFCPSILPKSTMGLGHHSSFRCDWGRRRCLVWGRCCQEEQDHASLDHSGSRWLHILVGELDNYFVGTISPLVHPLIRCLVSIRKNLSPPPKKWGRWMDFEDSIQGQLPWVPGCTLSPPATTSTSQTSFNKKREVKSDAFKFGDYVDEELSFLWSEVVETHGDFWEHFFGGMSSGWFLFFVFVCVF